MADPQREISQDVRPTTTSDRREQTFYFNQKGLLQRLDYLLRSVSFATIASITPSSRFVFPTLRPSGRVALRTRRERTQQRPGSD